MKVSEIRRCRTNSMLKVFLSSSFFAALITQCPLVASAAEIVINDCDGITRAQIELSDAAERKDLNVVLERINTATNTDVNALVEELTIKSANFSKDIPVAKREAYIQNLQSGSYEICGKNGSARFASVYFVSPSSQETTALGSIAAGTAAISGAVLALAGGGSSGNSANEANSGTILNKPTGNAPATSSATGSSSVSALPASKDDRDCLNFDRITPISPFN